MRCEVSTTPVYSPSEYNPRFDCSGSCLVTRANAHNFSAASVNDVVAALLYVLAHLRCGQRAAADAGRANAMRNCNNERGGDCAAVSEWQQNVTHMPLAGR